MVTKSTWYHSTVWLDKQSRMANFLYCDWSPQTRVVSGLYNSTHPLSQQDRHVLWLRYPRLPKIALCYSAINLHFSRLRCRGRNESGAWEWAGWHPERRDVESREGDHVETGSSHLRRQQPEPWVACTVVVEGKKKWVILNFCIIICKSLKGTLTLIVLFVTHRWKQWFVRCGTFLTLKINDFQRFYFTWWRCWFLEP